jgi:hypothetical protein
MAKAPALPPGMDEYRLIFFRESELIRALGAYRRVRKDPLPPGQIARLQCDSKSMRVTLFVQLDDGEMVRAGFEAPEVAAALIVHCKDVRIPLSRTAEKSLRMVAGRPAFLIKEHGGLPDGDDSVEFKRLGKAPA